MRMLAAVAVLALVGCGGAGSPAPSATPAPTGFLGDLQGAWTMGCNTAFPPTSERLDLVFSGSTMTDTVTSWSNNSCSGPGTIFRRVTKTVSIGGAVSSPLGASTVTAHQVDLSGPGSAEISDFDLLYVDTTSRPGRLYMGRYSGGGTTTQNRPTQLGDQIWFSRP